MRQTSIDAYNTIKMNGLLSKRRWQVYDFLYHNGPATCRQTVKEISKGFGQSVAVTYSSFSSRFSELKRAGVIVEVATVVDSETNNEVLVWDVTPAIPKKLTTIEKLKQSIERHKIAIANLEKRITDANLQR